jgi:hypothetical protein
MGAKKAARTMSHLLELEGARGGVVVEVAGEVEGEEQGEEGDAEGSDGVCFGAFAFGDKGEQDRAR